MEYRKKKKQMCSNWVLAIFIIVAVLLLAAAAIFKKVAETESKKRLKQIDREVQYQNLVSHLKKLDSIKDGRWSPANYNTTANYIEKTLSPYIGTYYTAERRPVNVTAYDLVADSAIFNATFTGEPVTYVSGIDFSVDVPPDHYAYVEENLTVPENDGCNSSDYSYDSLSIVHDGGRCTKEDRINAAAEAGVQALIIILEPGKELTPPTKRRTMKRPIPVFTVRDSVGAAIMIAVKTGGKLGYNVKVVVSCNFTLDVKTSYNLLISSKIHKTNNTIVLGAHMDSSPLAGTAVNDNGSGMAAVLEFAKLAAQYNIYKSAYQKVVFAFWGLGEEGQLGSMAYLDDMEGTPELDNIVAYINAFMLGSPNYAYFVTNASEVATASAHTGTYYLNYNLTGKYIRSKSGKCEIASPNAFVSDHIPFWELGIPAINICSGADGSKTASEYDRYGGYIYAPYDSCFHRTCDNLKHLDKAPFELLSKAVAYTAESLIVEEDIRKVIPK